MIGILQKIKSFLFPEDTVEVVIPKEVVPFLELSVWVDNHTSHYLKSISDSAQSLIDRFDDAIFSCETNISKLEHAELRNKNISSRELELMKGNRVSYLNRTKQFLAALSSFCGNVKKDGTINYKELEYIYKQISAEIEAYHKASLKPYAVLQYFFANESYAVAKQIKEMDILLKELHTLLEKQSTEAILTIKEDIALVAEKLSLQKELLAEKQKIEDELHKALYSQEQTAQKMSTIKDSDSYKKYIELISHAEEHEKKLQQHIGSLLHSFSVIEKAMRKYSKLEPSKELFINNYLKEPLESLLADKDLQVVSVIADVKRMLLSDALDIKDEKKEKTALGLEQLSLAFFQNFVEEYNKLCNEKKHFEHLCSSDVAANNYKEAEYMLKTYKEKVEALRKDSLALNEKIEKLDINKHITKLEQDIQLCIKREVEIVAYQ